MTSQPTSVFAPQLRAATAAILLAVALTAFEGLAVAAALPQVAGDLGGVGLLPWVITSFLLTSGVATVAAGPLVDGLGVAKTFRVAVAVFAVAGTLAGLAPSMPVLIVARVVQGAGAGATVATALAAVGLVFPASLVGRAFALNSTVWGVMGVAAPALAATLLTVASWRWVFLVNLPLGVVALAAGWRSLPGPVRSASPALRIDAVGIGLVTAFAGALLVAVDALGPGSVAAALVAIAAAWWYVRRARSSPDPVLRPRHLLDAPFGPLAWTIGLVLAGAFAAQAFVPLYVRGARGAGAAVTAWSVLFFTVGWTLGANVGSRLPERLAGLRTVLLGVALVAPSIAAVGVLALLDAPLTTLFVALTVAGVGVGAGTNAALTLLRAAAVDDELGRASAAHQFVRNQGIAMGSALGGAVVVLVLGRATGDVEMARGVLSGDSGVASQVVSSAIADGFAIAALAGAVLAGLAAIPLRVLLRRRGSRKPAVDRISR